MERIEKEIMTDKTKNILDLQTKLLEYTVDYSTTTSDNQRRRNLLVKIKEIRKTLNR